MKITKINPDDALKLGGTSYHGHDFRATPDQLKKLFGDPTYEDNSGSDKVNMDWDLQLEDGTVFTLYDWKKYRPLEGGQRLDWHIGTHTEEESGHVKLQLLKIKLP